MKLSTPYTKYPKKIQQKAYFLFISYVIWGSGHLLSDLCYLENHKNKFRTVSLELKCWLLTNVILMYLKQFELLKVMLKRQSDSTNNLYLCMLSSIKATYKPKIISVIRGF